MNTYFAMLSHELKAREEKEIRIDRFKIEFSVVNGGNLLELVFSVAQSCNNGWRRILLKIAYIRYIRAFESSTSLIRG